MTLQLRQAAPADLPFAKQQLRAAGLPTADLRADMLVFAADVDGKVQGVIGCEPFGDVALLRSLVVAETLRGQGAGARLVKALETDCAKSGAQQMWLLTIDAAAFFAGLGYTERGRDQAPVAIRNTAEFSGLCPADAVVRQAMARRAGFSHTEIMALDARLRDGSSLHRPDLEVLKPHRAEVLGHVRALIEADNDIAPEELDILHKIASALD